ncbi:MAG: InlB B-repeat-containing protein [Saccharofermentans sp.]|nr:InlB B-repeat-containing protein [Saccharofermentans sp.]
MLKAKQIKKAIASSVVALAILFTAVPALSQTVYADETDTPAAEESVEDAQNAEEEGVAALADEESSEESTESSEESTEATEEAAPVVGLQDLRDSGVIAQEGQSNYISFTAEGRRNFDVRGRFGDSYIRSTFSNGGYNTAIQVGENPIRSVRFDYLGQVVEIDGVQVRIVCGLDASGRAVVITYDLFNLTDAEQTVKIGSYADTMIGTNDRARVSYTSNGILMEDNNERSSTYGATLRLMPGNADFTTRWYGYYYSAGNNVFNNVADSSVAYNEDSGIAYSWTLTIAPSTQATRTSLLGLYEESYSVTYDANGGVGEMTDINSPYGIGLTATVMDNGFYAPEGYEFIGWNTAADGSGTTYYPGNTINLSSSVTLYASWVSTRGTYEYVEGMNGQWTQNSTNGLAFRATRVGSDALTFSRFLGVQVDGQDIGPDRFDVASGSVIVTLKADYLQALAPGEHTITLTFTDGDPITTNFTIIAAPAPTAAPAVPATGEAMSVLPVAGAICIAAAGAVVLTRKFRKEEI